MVKTVKCIVCGKLVEYTTKKPMWCKECRASKNAVRKPRNKSKNNLKSKWKSEAYMFKVLGELMPKTQYAVNGYYSFLSSPKGEPMQLDWYSYELGLAFEYQGSQHYTHNKYFQKTKADFKYLQTCDKLKKELCSVEGITLVDVKFDEEMNVRNMAYLLKKTDKSIFDILLKDGALNLTKEDIDSINKK